MILSRYIFWANVTHLAQRYVVDGDNVMELNVPDRYQACRNRTLPLFAL